MTGEELCAHRKMAQDPMGGMWCQDCDYVEPPYPNWLDVILNGAEPKPHAERSPGRASTAPKDPGS